MGGGISNFGGYWLIWIEWFGEMLAREGPKLDFIEIFGFCAGWDAYLVTICTLVATLVFLSVVSPTSSW